MPTRALLRGFAVWCCLIVVEVIHGIARAVWLVPIVGGFRARQIGVFLGSLLILIVAVAVIGWVRPARAREALAVGLLWLVSTLAFEVIFGRFVVHASWARIASDYDLAHGGLLPIGLLVMTSAPFVAAKARRVL